jgi:hypothetical protein
MDRRKISDRRFYPSDDIPPLCLIDKVFTGDRRIMPDRRRNNVQADEMNIEEYLKNNREKK